MVSSTRGEVAIRLAQPADLDGILDVGRVTWRNTYTPLAGEDYVEKRLAEWWTREGTLPAIVDGRVLVAEHDGIIVGMAMYGVHTRVVSLWRLYVRPERQRLGIGRSLLNSVLTAARGRADRVSLAYMEGNGAARSFYERMGFVETHRDADEVGGPEDVWMVKPLKRVP